MSFITKYKKVLIDDKLNLNNRISFMLENIGIPINIPAMGIGDYSFDNVPFLLNNYSVVLGFIESEPVNHFLLLNIENENIFHQWNYDEVPNKVFINSDFEKLLLCTNSYNFFLKRLIMSKSFGSYYDNTPQGGNFKKYANLLKELILDIDERAANEGAWHSLIQEMSIGAI